MIDFYYGEEKYLIFLKLSQKKASFVKSNPTAHVVEFDLEEIIDPKKIREELLSGGGLFSQNKLVILKNIGKLSSQQQDELLEMLKNTTICEEEEVQVVIVLLGKDKLESRLKGFLTRKTKRKIKALEFKKKKGEDVEKWIVSEVKRKTDNEILIDKGAVSYLASITNADLWQINGEVDKLISFVGEREISLKDVKLMCNGSNEVGIFELVDAIGQKNIEKAMELKGKLISQGINEFYIFTMIVSQIRNLVKVSDCVKRGNVNPEMISKKSGIHPFVAKKTLAQLRGFSNVKLRATFDLAAKIDQQVKVGQRNMQETLDYFIARI